MKLFVIACMTVLLMACSSPPDENALLRIQGKTMGTEYSALWPAAQFKDAEIVQRQLEDRLQAINASMSTYDPESELSRINQMPIERLEQGITISSDLATVLRMSQVVFGQSQGAFDVTIGPLVNVWGFGPDPFSGKKPSPEQVAGALAQVNANAIQLSDSQLIVSQPIYIDLSAVAKGWAVNELASVLEQQGITQFLVEIGGELYGKGLKPNGEPWRIAIERPSQDGRRQSQLVLPLTDMGIATSGDYRNFFMHDGVRYSHTIDPRNGYPIDHDLASISVLHPSVGLADAWATALTVVGTERALALAEQYDLAVFILQRQGEHYNEVYSSRFQQLFADAIDEQLN